MYKIVEEEAVSVFASGIMFTFSLLFAIATDQKNKPGFRTRATLSRNRE